MWIAKAYRRQEPNDRHIPSPRSPSGKNARMTLASALAPPELLSGRWLAAGSAAQSLQPSVFGGRQQKRRPSGRCASSPSRSVPRSILTGKHIFHVNPIASILGLENKHTLNMLFPKDTLTINIYQATNNWEHKGISHEKFFIKNGIFGAQKMTQLVKCLTCILKDLFDLHKANIAHAWNPRAEEVETTDSWVSQAGLAYLASFRPVRDSSYRERWNAPEKLHQRLSSRFWCTHTHTHMYICRYRHIYPCTHT